MSSRGQIEVGGEDTFSSQRRKQNVPTSKAKARLGRVKCGLSELGFGCHRELLSLGALAGETKQGFARGSGLVQWERSGGLAWQRREEETPPSKAPGVNENAFSVGEKVARYFHDALCHLLGYYILVVCSCHGPPRLSPSREKAPQTCSQGN